LTFFNGSAVGHRAITVLVKDTGEFLIPEKFYEPLLEDSPIEV
jgi:hypothetical protein